MKNDAISKSKDVVLSQTKPFSGTQRTSSGYWFTPWLQINTATIAFWWFFYEAIVSDKPERRSSLLLLRFFEYSIS